MGHRNREIESKLEIIGYDLEQINYFLHHKFSPSVSKMLFGSSTDTYWTIPDRRAQADFFRVRERDGIRQITVKGKDKGLTTDRLEIDVDSTSSFETIYKLGCAMYGEPAGRIAKTYYVYWLNKTDTVCCYKLTEPQDPRIFVEVEASSSSKMLDLEAKVLDLLSEQHIKCERSAGSLYEMFLEP